MLDENQVGQLCRCLVADVSVPAVFFLKGELGAGKTSWVKSCCSHLGLTTTVSSPTYALMNIYTTKAFDVIHLDLYRIQSDDDLSDLCLSDYLVNSRYVFVEWFHGFEELLPQPDFVVDITYKDKLRHYQISAFNDHAEAMLSKAIEIMC